MLTRMPWCTDRSRARSTPPLPTRNDQTASNHQPGIPRNRCRIRETPSLPRQRPLLPRAAHHPLVNPKKLLPATAAAVTAATTTTTRTPRLLRDHLLLMDWPRRTRNLLPVSRILDSVRLLPRLRLSDLVPVLGRGVEPEGSSMMIRLLRGSYALSVDDSKKV
jgi:hypothetical protein